jgi:hypothetical protein
MEDMGDMEVMAEPIRDMVESDTVVMDDNPRYPNKVSSVPQSRIILFSSIFSLFSHSKKSKHPFTGHIL